MIYENHEVITLEPVRYEIAQITYGQIPQRGHHGRAKAKSGKKEGWLIDAVLKNGLLLLIVLAMFTAVNLIGFENFIDNLKQVVNNQGIDGFLVNAEFV